MTIDDRSTPEVLTPDAVIAPRDGDGPPTSFRLSDAVTTAVAPAVADIGEPGIDRMAPQTVAAGTAADGGDGGEGAGESGYLLQLSIIFNDPDLYALRIALDGPAAKIFKGLDFQILYKRVSDTVGVYKAEIKLPDVMRQLTIGAYSVTLPVFAIDIYTNGDFMIDVGFPWNQDFTRSFTVQGIVPPGIPVLGAAGFYFGKLSGATSNQLPVYDPNKGQFNPVIVFGFGLQVGVGKTIEAGILRAGFSITAFGIIEGVIARWNPYGTPAITGGDNDSDVQSSYYFWLQGTIGIIGKLYGSIDFAIIKAEVNIQLMVMVQITFQSYADIPISVVAAVSVSVAIKINLGLFTITINLSFSATVKATFTIKNPDHNAPWLPSGGFHAESVQGLHARRLRDFQLEAAGANPSAFPTMTWTNLPKPQTQVKLVGYYAPIVTVSADGASAMDDQTACYVHVMMLGAAPAGDAPPTGDEQSFQTLAVQVLRWILAASQAAGSPGASNPDGLVVSDQSLLATEPTASDLNLVTLVNYLTYSCNPDPTPMPAAEINTFLTDQFMIDFTSPTAGGSANATAFPMPPAMNFAVDSYGSTLNYDFATFNALSDTYLADLRTYFDSLAVVVQEEMDRQEAMDDEAVVASTSMGSYVFSDYFALVAKQMLKGLQDALRNYAYEIGTANGANETTADVAAWVQAAMKLGGPDDGVTYTAADIFEGNTGHPLTEGTAAEPQLLSIVDLTHQVGNGETLTTISQTYTKLANDGGSAFDATALATSNQSAAGILLSGGTVKTAEGTYTITADDTLARIATAQFGGNLDQLVSLNADNARLFAPLAVLALPVVNYNVAAGDTLALVAQVFGKSVADLAYTPPVDNPPPHPPVDAPALFSTAGEDPNAKLLSLPHLPRFKVAELLAEVVRTGSVNHLSGMVGRYSLHGLRLPTDGITPGLTPVEGTFGYDAATDNKLLPELGLFALTGQQFPIPEQFIDAVVYPQAAGDAADPYTFTLTAAGATWAQFDGATTKDISIDPAQPDAYRIKAVYEAATQRGVKPALNKLGMQKLFSSTPSEYVFISKTIWQSAGQVALPYGTAPDGPPALALWQLPQSLVNLPHSSAAPNPNKDAAPVLPRFTIRTSTYNEATGRTDRAAVSNYGWATKVAVTIKKVPAVAASPSTAYSYELLGANESDIVLLERLLGAISRPGSEIESLTLLYYPSPTGNAREGLQSDGNERITMFITQANLSTYTNPPGFRVEGAEVTEAAEVPARKYCYNTFYDFVLLLWECSITRSGGYYLYYYDDDRKGGFPDRVFNDQGEATLELLVTHQGANGGVDADDQNRVAGYMNCAVTGEYIDPAKSSVSAVADPIALPVTYTAVSDPSIMCADPSKYTLACLAETYYMDPLELAEQNAGVDLAAGAQIDVTRGTYLVTPAGAAGPGGVLDDVVSHFAISNPADLTGANPGVTWPAPAYTLILLPPLTLTIGTSPGGSTLASIATFYGAQLGDLAADNQTKPALFGASPLHLTPGPRARSGSSAPGSVSLEAIRTVPPAVPDTVDWSNAAQREGFADLYLEHAYNLLGYRIAPNRWFNRSNMGLPMGPTEASAPENSTGKVTAVTAKAAGDLWTYQQGVPYWRCVSHEGDDGKCVEQTVNGIPDPYNGVGDILQIEFGWQDLFGNVTFTPLDDPSLDPDAPLNFSPLPVGYTDALVGLAKWPSVAASYRVFNNVSTPTLRFEITFDSCPYTQPAGEACGRTKPNDNWQENAKRDLNTYLKLWLQLQDKTDDTTYAVSFSVSSSLLGSTPIALAEAQADSLRAWVGDIVAYLTKLSTAAQSSEFTSANGCDATTPNVHCIDLVLDPTGAAVHQGPGDPYPVDQTQLYELTSAFAMARPITHVAADFRDTPEVYDSVTTLAPYRPAASEQPNGGTISLTQFTQDFEKALATSAAVLKVAEGIDRERASQSAIEAPLWVVRLALDDGGIAYTVPDTGTPTLFSPRPISNRLESRPDPDRHLPAVSIWDYVQGSGTAIDFDAEPTRTLAFEGIDMDVWGREFVAAFDGLLTPELSSPAAIVGEFYGVAYIDQLLAAKKQLADAIKTLVIPVIRGETATAAEKDAAQEAFKQTTLVALSNMYSTEAVIQFHSTVNADLPQPPNLSEKSPRLYGLPVPTTTDDADVVLSSAKIDLVDGDSLLTMLLSSNPNADQTYRRNFVELDLDFVGSNIEQQIGSLRGIEDYEASSWLTFLCPPVKNSVICPDGPDTTLTQPLGSFYVPLPIRAFPTPPSMIAQGFQASASETGDLRALAGAELTSKLQDLLRWDYELTYSEAYHYPQDRTYFEVVFNVRDAVMAQAVVADDLFACLAEFVTVWPAIQTDLQGSLASIDGARDPSKPETQKQYDIAQAALESFIAVAGRVATAWLAEGAGSPAVTPPFECTTDNPNLYRFYVEEHENVPAEPCPGSSRVGDLPIGALCVHLTCKPSAALAIEAPWVKIADWEADRTEVDPGYVYTYWKDEKSTKDCAGQPAEADQTVLSAAQGAAIAQRQVVLPDLYILAKQDAWASAYLTRNEQLLPEGQPATAAPFVYTTSAVKFANPIHPTIDTTEVVHIECIGAQQPTPTFCDDPQTRTLDEHLTALFTSLFTGDPETQQTVQMEVRYDYAIQDALTPISLPVMLVPPTDFAVATDSTPCANSPDSLVCKVTDAFWAWFAANTPAEEQASIWFDLTVFSRQTTQPMPLVRLRNLQLGWQYVTRPS